MATTPVEQLARRICAQRGYDFVRACNAGAFKQTFQIRRDGQDLALKLLTKPPDPERLKREIEALCACRNENICQLLLVDAEQIDGVPVIYFVEEFIAGGTLSERVRANGLLGPADARTLAIAMSRAIAHLAECRIVHRDIKPDNIMYRTDGTPVLVDLGIARHLDATSLTQTWASMGPGTPAFAAPEQLLNQKNCIDWRTDQFALGVTLSVAALGMHPYSGNLDFDLAIQHVGEHGNHARVFVETANARGLNTLLRMTAAWPIKRFTQPRQLLEAWHPAGA